MRVKLISMVLLALAALFPAKAFAIATPDNLLIESVKAYGDVLESGDMLVLVRYDIDYSVIPAEVVSETFVGRFMRGTTELNATELFNFQNGGYGQGVFSFYFSSAAMTDNSVEYNDPNAENYTVVLQGKPTAFSVPPTISSTTITYRNTAITEQILTSDTIALARVLQDDAVWAGNGIELIDFSTGQQVLTSDGESYFGQVVPNMNVMIPELFGSSVTSVFLEERSFTFSERDKLDGLWDGRALDDSFAAGAGLFDTSKQMFKTVALGIPFIIFGVVLGVVLASGSPNAPEFGICTTAVTIPIAARIGLISMTFAMVIGLLAAVALGFVFFLRRA